MLLFMLYVWFNLCLYLYLRLYMNLHMNLSMDTNSNANTNLQQNWKSKDKMKIWIRIQAFRQSDDFTTIQALFDKMMILLWIQALFDEMTTLRRLQAFFDKMMILLRIQTFYYEAKHLPTYLTNKNGRTTKQKTGRKREPTSDPLSFAHPGKKRQYKKG